MNKYFCFLLLFSNFIFISACEKQNTSRGSQLSDEKIEATIDDQINSSFYISEISDEVFKSMRGKSYKDNCTVPRSSLRHLHVLHKNLEGEICKGDLICNEKIAAPVLDIFKELFKAGYPIEKIRLIDEYDADDEKSMSDNNSSSFNFRFISHTSTVSKHGLGMAIDINPLYNPYFKFVKGKENVEPEKGILYLDRSKNFPYKIDHADLAYQLFTKAGFEWGGDWQNVKDYQHFEWPDE